MVEPRQAPSRESGLIDYEQLRPFATPRQLEILDALQKHGTQSRAAKALGVGVRRVERNLQDLRMRAALRGMSPDHDMTHPAPDGFLVKGVSTLYTPEGIAAQWVKTDQDRERALELAHEVVAALSEDIKREKPSPKPKHRTDADLLNLYVVTDHHIGMFSWAEETGADWDCAIAEDLLVAWFQRAVASAPDAKVGLLSLLGDLCHYDSLEAVTPARRNVLDADSRFAKLVRVAIRAIRRVVKMLLEKHDEVHIVVSEGNHDEASSVWLREWLGVLYESDPRVTVDQSPSSYHAYEFGNVLLAFHHGHRRKLKAVDEVIAAQFREQYGRTRYCYIHVGHRHEQAVVESNIAVTEQHRTLAAPDAYAARSGWLSGRSACAISYHRDYGEVGRVVISPELATA